jgi:hypothetical protein
MRVEINVTKKRVRRQDRAVLISFDTCSDKFDSAYERNKFFRQLHGWKQIIPGKAKKRYLYHRDGLLDEVPHIKVADSAFIISMRNMEKMMEFFEQWADKVHCEMLKIVLGDKEWRKLN